MFHQLSSHVVVDKFEFFNQEIVLSMKTNQNCLKEDINGQPSLDNPLYGKTFNILTLKHSSFHLRFLEFFFRVSLQVEDFPYSSNLHEVTCFYSLLGFSYATRCKIYLKLFYLVFISNYAFMV